MLSGQLGNSLSMIDENLDLMQTNQLFISEIFRTSKYFMLLRLGLGFGQNHKNSFQGKVSIGTPSRSLKNFLQLTRARLLSIMYQSMD